MNASFDHVLARGGHSGALIASRDWSSHALGPIELWPVPLKNALSLCLVSKVPSSVWWGVDGAELIEFHNDAYRPVIGPNRHAQAMGALGKEIWPERWHTVRETLGRVLAAGQACDHKDSFVLLDRNGIQEETYFDHAHSPLYADDGQVAGVFSIVNETTARVLSERRLRTLKALAEHASRTHGASDAAQTYASLLCDNTADVPFCLVYGRSCEPQGYAGVSGDAAQSARERLPLERALQSDDPLLVDFAIEQVPREGRKPPERACILPVRERPDEPARAVLVVGLSPHLHFDACYRDFLQLAAAQLANALSHAHSQREQLERMSREREQLLRQEQEARATAEAANRVKDEFLAVLGHELRNPLAPITTALALMRHKAPLDHEALIIERQVGHLRRLVEDLLDVSRITRGKVELKRKPLNLASVVREAIELASPLLEEREQHLSVDLPAAGLEVLGDRTRLAQVLANLLTNASKYSGRATLISVSGSVQPEQDVVEISVRDRGIGIEPEMLPSVWNAFTQGAQAIDRSHGGLGLGLTIVRSLVELHGGSVAAYSAGKGQGSEFCVRLPRLAAESADAPEPRARPPQPQMGVFGGYKVLLVDDNEDAVELLAEWFRARSAIVETALDGVSALELAKHFSPDVALLDLGLPAMNGYEVARRLRAQEAQRELVLIAVTGYGEQSARKLTNEAGFDDHCVKPLDLTQFEQRLRAKLAQR